MLSDYERYQTHEALVLCETGRAGHSCEVQIGRHGLARDLAEIERQAAASREIEELAVLAAYRSCGRMRAMKEIQT